MNSTQEYSFTRYLSAKKTVDDRALNLNVWKSLKQALASMNGGRGPRILEIGAGIGTMFERSVDWGLCDEGEYTGLDAMEENVSQACCRLPEWAASREYSVKDHGAGQYLLADKGREIRARFVLGDIFEFIADKHGVAQWDLLIANAFLDLVDVASALPRILSLLRPGGLFYFTINFDGASIFQPEIDPELDALIERLYHQTMDQRTVAGRQSGDSRTGRHFFEHIRRSGAELLNAGSSDWVVFAGPNGYPADEAFFLHFIVHTVGGALKEHSEMDRTSLSDWVAKRHSQIDAGTLVYIAHQIDFLGRLSP